MYTLNYLNIYSVIEHKEKANISADFVEIFLLKVFLSENINIIQLLLRHLPVSFETLKYIFGLFLKQYIFSLFKHENQHKNIKRYFFKGKVLKENVLL